MRRIGEQKPLIDIVNKDNLEIPFKIKLYGAFLGYDREYVGSGRSYVGSNDVENCLAGVIAILITAGIIYSSFFH